jgi:plasmid stability protein
MLQGAAASQPPGGRRCAAQWCKSVVDYPTEIPVYHPLRGLAARVWCRVVHLGGVMAELKVTGIPEEEFSALALRAARHGRTVEEEARHLLHEAAAEQMLVAELERATRATEAVQAKLNSVQPARPMGAAARRQRKRTEPTPRRR